MSEDIRNAVYFVRLGKNIQEPHLLEETKIPADSWTILEYFLSLQNVPQFTQPEHQSGPTNALNVLTTALFALPEMTRSQVIGGGVIWGTIKGIEHTKSSIQTLPGRS